MKEASHHVCCVLNLLLVATLLTTAVGTNVEGARKVTKNHPHGGELQPTTNTQSGTPQSCEETRSNLERLNQEVPRLRKRLAELEKDRLVNTIQDMLTKEEQRGEGLQLHLIEIAEKEEPLQRRMDQLTQQLRPERIESMMSGVGSVHPEEAREELRKRLVTERFRVQAQLDLLRQDRMRTQQSLATTDAAIQRLKLKLTEALKD